MSERDTYTMQAQLCDADGIVRRGAMHHGMDYRCTGSAHYDGEHIECTHPLHRESQYIGDRPRIVWAPADLLVLVTAERDALSGALTAIAGPADSGPWVEVYRQAGGGYEGLQAIARAALAREAATDPTEADHD